MSDVFSERAARAAAVAGRSVSAALDAGDLKPRIDLTAAEALVLGLLEAGVRDYFVVLGHGTTELGEVLRAYTSAGAVRCHPVRHEAEAAHAATALRWTRDQRAAVVTSIGPGALHAMAGSLAASSNGIGVWHIYGDETTEDEGPNMQQLPGAGQGGFHRLASAMGDAYTVHTPAAVTAALRHGIDVVDRPYGAGPFFVLFPINTQPAVIPAFNLRELPLGKPPRLGPAAGTFIDAAAFALAGAPRVAVKLGGGSRGLGAVVQRLVDRLDAVTVQSPRSLGVVDPDHPRTMGVGGSKGSISGNHAMEHAETLIVIGSRAVCQADCSRTGYPKVRQVININADPGAALHYQNTLALVGDAAATITELLERLGPAPTPAVDSPWTAECAAAKTAWRRHCAERLASPVLHDDVWGRPVLTQPAAIAAIAEVAERHLATLVFDAGDVQANGFQIVEPRSNDRYVTEAGASYMGFAASAVLATAVADDPFYAVAVCGDGSFTMNPQALIDGVALGATGCIVVLDNRRMGAISSLQRAQYLHDFATHDGVAVDYCAWASSIGGVRALFGGHTVTDLQVALESAIRGGGLSLIHVPVYFGDDPLGGLGAFGRWNVGPWVHDVQAMRHDLAL